MADPADETHAPVRKRVAATMLIRDPHGRLLIVDPTYKDRWELPGGAVEADESPAAAARREIAEELGLAIAPGRLLALDHVPADPTGTGRTEGLIVVFDGGLLPDLSGVVLPPDELRDAAFVAVDTLDAYLPALQARRARASLAARAAGTVAYLEDGHATHDESPTSRRRVTGRSRAARRDPPRTSSGSGGCSTR